MVTEVERLAVLIEANTKSYERAIARVEGTTNRGVRKSTRSLSRLDKSLNLVGKSAVSFGRNFAGAFGAGALLSIGAFSTAIGAALNDLSRISDVADKVGLTTDELQELRFAARESGIETSQLDTAVQRFSRRIAEAANGTGELKTIIEENNIQLRDAQGNIRPLNDILGDYADLVKGTTSDQEQLRLAFKAFDTEGAQLVLVLEQGADGLARLQQEAQELNQVIDEESVRSADAFADRWERASNRITVAFQRGIVAAVEFVDELGKVAEAQVNAALGIVEPNIEDNTGRPDRQPPAQPIDPSIEIRRRARELLGNGLGAVPKISPLKDLTNTFELSKKQIDQVSSSIDKLETKTDNLGSTAESSASRFESAFASAFSNLELTGNRFLDSLISTFAGASLHGVLSRRGVAQGTGGLGASSGLGGFSIPGLAQGGSGTFGGVGGIDRNLLQLNGTPIAKVSRGEGFSIGKGGGRTIVQVMPNIPGVDIDVQEQRSQVGEDEIVRVLMTSRAAKRGIRDIAQGQTRRTR